MGRAWVPETKEVQDTTACWQGDGQNILGRIRRYYVGLFTQEKYNNWSVLCKLARPAENRHPAVEEWFNAKDPDFSVLGLWHLNTVGLSASH